METKNNTMAEDYVSFETAKLLKGKGFNYPCMQYTYQEGIDHHIIFTEGEVNWNNEYGNPVTKTVSIPTLQMAMKWLREVCGFFIQIKLSFRVKKNEYEAEIMSFQKKWTVVELVRYDTYEEIAEAAIKYCLTNLL